jgi:hypothetical protein
VNPFKYNTEKNKDSTKIRICKFAFQPNYKKLGLKKGLLHAYLRTGNIKKVAEDLLSNEGIMSSGIHAGNSDIVGELFMKDSEQLVDLISKVKDLEYRKSCLV